MFRKRYDDEATDSRIYAALAKQTTSRHNRELLLTMASDEKRHCDTWGTYLEGPPKVHRFRVWLYTTLARIFGLVFVINLLESNEDSAVRIYSRMGEELPVALEMVEDESRHE